MKIPRSMPRLNKRYETQLSSTTVLTIEQYSPSVEDHVTVLSLLELHDTGFRRR